MSVLNRIPLINTALRAFDDAVYAIKDNASNKGVDIAQDLNDTIVYGAGSVTGVARESFKLVHKVADTVNVDKLVNGLKDLIEESDADKELRELLEEADREIDKARAQERIIRAKAKLDAVKGE